MDALYWLLFNFLAILASAFFSMSEMACVSLNKVRLQYFVSKESRQALFLRYLLNPSSRLFGVTLIGVNLANITSAECGRRVFSSLDMNPDLAPAIQVFLVVIFGELAPMFAARGYSEHVAYLSSPILYTLSKLLAPVLWGLSLLQESIHSLLFKKGEKVPLLITQEELQSMVDEHQEEMPHENETEEFNTVTSRIFHLGSSNVSLLMTPLSDVVMLKSNQTVEEAIQIFQQTKVEFLPIFNKEKTNIVGIAYPKDLVRAGDLKRVRDYCKDVWFAPQTTSLLQILEQFRFNCESVAVLINQTGQSIGIITLNACIEALFGNTSLSRDKNARRKQKTFIDKTFDGATPVKLFNRQTGVKLSTKEHLTLSELMIETIERVPSKEETVTIGSFDLIAKEVAFRTVKSVIVRSHF